jgi:hypothetical protein
MYETPQNLSYAGDAVRCLPETSTGNAILVHCGKPLAAVDHIVLAIAADVALDVGRIARGDGRLCHREGGADPTFHQGTQPAILLLGFAVMP